MVQDGDFLGERYDYARSTVCSTEKTKKVEAVWSHRDGWSNRQFAGLMGLLLFAANTANASLAACFNLLRAFRNFSARMAVGHQP